MERQHPVQPPTTRTRKQVGQSPNHHKTQQRQTEEDTRGWEGARGGEIKWSPIVEGGLVRSMPLSTTFASGVDGILTWSDVACLPILCGLLCSSCFVAFNAAGLACHLAPSPNCRRSCTLDCGSVSRLYVMLRDLDCLYFGYVGVRDLKFRQGQRWVDCCER